MKSNIMKGISYTVLILGTIGSFIGGIVFKTFNFEEQRFVYNIELVIIGVIMVLIMFFVLLGLSTALDRLEDIEIEIHEMKKSNLDLNINSNTTMSTEENEQNIESPIGNEKNKNNSLLKGLWITAFIVVLICILTLLKTFIIGK